MLEQLINSIMISSVVGNYQKIVYFSQNKFH